MCPSMTAPTSPSGSLLIGPIVTGLWGRWTAELDLLMPSAEVSGCGGPFPIGRPKDPVADGEGDVEVVLAHQGEVVVTHVVLPQQRDGPAPADPRLLRQVVSEVEPLIRQEVAHRHGDVEPPRVG